MAPTRSFAARSVSAAYTARAYAAHRSEWNPWNQPGAFAVRVAYVPLAGHIRRVLDERASHSAPASRFRDELEDSMSEAQAEQTLRSVISWARYGEAFAYDEQTGAFNLDNPS